MPPTIPDHEMLRVIGRGAYGEIWLARSITGAWRAVKVIWRANFDHERIFQREFGGMTAFEPVSRAHRGFVHLLHVGRDPHNAFFYYIMELADDVGGGKQIEPETYQPRTLASELTRETRLPAAECIRLGVALTSALAELHRHGLAHRDIKPANIIFVGGEPKLADIGLVAATGQKSFVGTEGYVPAEGPGSNSADLYSLGKVLYEISMGRDRMDFPDLPDDLDERDDRALLLRLNPVLLKACANDPKRRHASAAAMGHELALLDAERKKRPVKRMLAALLLLLAGWTAFHFTKSAPNEKPGSVTILTEPPGATVLLGEKVRSSPAKFSSVEPGDYRLHIMRDGFAPVDIRMKVEPEQNAAPAAFVLARSHGDLEITSEPAGAACTLEGPLHFRDEKPTRQQGVTPFSCKNLPTGEYRIVAQIAAATVEQTVELQPNLANTAQLRFTNGSVKIISAPNGARVLHNGVEIGHTPCLLDDITPGEVDYEIQLPGWRTAHVQGKVEAASQTFLAARLERERIVTPGQPFTNSLGQKLLPLPDVADLWVADTETRVRDWLEFCAATGAVWQKPDFASTDLYPVVSVNWNDANAFCHWLTAREQAAGQIDQTLEYRLPTDAEWSAAAGLPVEPGDTPEKRDGRNKELFPWGKTWPPPPAIANLGLPKYADGYLQTAPVASFPPNSNGFYDLSGNVWEWCADSYNASERGWGLLRGGSWGTKDRAEILSAYRNVTDRNERDVVYGFRYVLAPVTAP
ncbi:MAG: SUMF1/EgtB/PvdO family nonheme iron enzyme [Chthoniobacterales bacterium]